MFYFDNTDYTLMLIGVELSIFRDKSKQLKEWYDKNVIDGYMLCADPITIDEISAVSKFGYLAYIPVYIYEKLEKDEEYIISVHCLDKMHTSDRNVIMIINMKTKYVAAVITVPSHIANITDVINTILEKYTLLHYRMVIDTSNNAGASFFKHGTILIHKSDLSKSSIFASYLTKEKMENAFMLLVKNKYKDFPEEEVELNGDKLGVELKTYLIGICMIDTLNELYKENNNKIKTGGNANMNDKNNIRLESKKFNDEGNLDLVYREITEKGEFIKTYKNLPFPIIDRLPIIKVEDDKTFIKYLGYEFLDRDNDIEIHTYCSSKFTGDDVTQILTDKFGYNILAIELYDDDAIQEIYNMAFDYRDKVSERLIEKGFDIDGKLYLKYCIETNIGQYTREYRCLPLPINESKLPEINEVNRSINFGHGIKNFTVHYASYLDTDYFVYKTGYGCTGGRYGSDYRIPNNNIVDITTRQVVEYATEMTIEEIEEQLGYKIKIIDKKGNE